MYRACYACGDPAPFGTAGQPTFCGLCRRAHFPDVQWEEEPTIERDTDGSGPDANRETMALPEG